MKKQYVLANTYANAAILVHQLKEENFVPTVILHAPHSGRAESEARRLHDEFKKLSGQNIPVKPAECLNGQSSTALGAGKYAPDADQIMAIVEPDHFHQSMSLFEPETKLEPANAYLIEADVPRWMERRAEDPQCTYPRSFTFEKSTVAKGYETPLVG